MDHGAPEAPKFLPLLVAAISCAFFLGMAPKPIVTEESALTELSDFTLPMLDGKMTSLSDYRGKNPVLLAFFATWCAPCNFEVPLLNKIKEKYESRGLILLAIDVEESKDLVERWARKRGVRYPIVLDQRGQVVRQYGLYSVPTNILIDFDGKVAFWHNVLPEERHLEAVLERPHSAR